MRERIVPTFRILFAKKGITHGEFLLLMKEISEFLDEPTEPLERCEGGIEFPKSNRSIRIWADHHRNHDDKWPWIRSDWLSHFEENRDETLYGPGKLNLIFKPRPGYKKWLIEDVRVIHRIFKKFFDCK